MHRGTILLGIALALTPISAESKKYKNTVYVYKVQDDAFSKSLSYIGLQELINPLGGTARRWMLRTWIEKDTKAVTHQLYAIISYYNQWRFYQAATNDSATELPFVSINREFGGCQGICSFTETIGVEVSDAFLRQKALTGFQVKLFAKSGDSLIIDVTPAQIQSQLLTDNQFLPQDLQWIAPAASKEGDAK